MNSTDKNSRAEHANTWVASSSVQPAAASRAPGFGLTLPTLLHVALYEPEIPPNTGNIARLCAANGVPLHIVGRPAFSLDDRAVRRAGLDYWPEVALHQHADLAALQVALPAPTRLLMLTTKASIPYTQCEFRPGDCLLFGPETRGLPEDVRALAGPGCALRIPMRNPNIRSLNLAGSVGIVLYEALRQLAPEEWR